MLTSSRGACEASVSKDRRKARTGGHPSKRAQRRAPPAITAKPLRGDEVRDIFTTSFAGTTLSESKLPCRLRWLAAAITGRLIGDPRVIRAIGQAGQGLAATEEEFRTGGIADRPMAGRLIQLQQTAAGSSAP